MERKCSVRAQRTPTLSDPAHRPATRPRSTPHPMEDLQRSIGNQAVQRLINSPCAQAKSVRPSEDQTEPEEMVAEDVMRMPLTSTPAQNALQEKCPECEAGKGGCSTCGHDDAGTPPAPAPTAPAPAPAPPPPPTYTFISRGSYGQTAANFTRPTCVAAAPPATTVSLAAGSAAPSITVFPNGTYSVQRNDGVMQTATCTRSAAGLAATQAHEQSHANGATAAVAAANTAQGLPKTFATAGECATALSAWNTSVNAAWANEVSHGPGTNPPTAQTFTQEHAAGSCTFV